MKPIIEYYLQKYNKTINISDIAKLVKHNSNISIKNITIENNISIGIPKSPSIDFNLSYLFVLAIIIFLIKFRGLFSPNPLKRFIYLLKLLGKKYYESNREFIRKSIFKKYLEKKNRLFEKHIFLLFLFGGFSKTILIEKDQFLCNPNYSILNYIDKDLLKRYPEYSMFFVYNGYIFNMASEVEGIPILKGYFGIWNFSSKKCENYKERTLIAYKDNNIIIGDKEFFIYNKKLNIDFNALDLAKFLYNQFKNINIPININIYQYIKGLSIPIAYLFYVFMTMFLLFRIKNIKIRKPKVDINFWGLELYKLTGDKKYLERKINVLFYIIERIKLLSNNNKQLSLRQSLTRLKLGLPKSINRFLVKRG